MAGESPVPLGHLFLSGLDAAKPRKRLFGGEYHEFSDVAMVAGYCYKTAALLGMAKSDCGDALAAMVWEPTKLDGYWQLCRESIAAREEQFESREQLTLGHFFLQSEFPEAYGETAFGAHRQNPKQAEGMFRRKIRPENAREVWTGAAAEGLAFGVLHPERTREMLEFEHAPYDPEKWKRAREAGLAIPSEQDVYPLNELTTDVLEGAKEFVQAFYPQLAAPLGWD